METSCVNSQQRDFWIYYSKSKRMCPSDDKVQKTLSRARELVHSLEELEGTDVQPGAWNSRLDDFLHSVLELKDAEKELYAAALDESSGKGRIREYLKQHEGEVVTSEELSRVSGIKEFARRIRELRNEEGFVIDSTRTHADLGSHEYIFVEIRDQQRKSRLHGAIREAYLDEHPACERCGFNPKEHNEAVGEKRFLEVDHIDPYSEFDNSDEANDFDNLQTLCNVCHNSKGTSDNMWNRR